MNLHDLWRHFQGQQLSVARRTLKQQWDTRVAGQLAPVLLPQRAVIREGICEDFELRIAFLTADPQLPLQEFFGQHTALQLLTDQGTWRSFPGLVAETAAGRFDGDLRAVHMVVRDPFHFMAERFRLRAFRDKSVIDVVSAVFDEWIKTTALGCSFSYTWLNIRSDCHPWRANFIQHADESDTAFVRRLLRAHGIAWFWRPQAPQRGDAHDAVPRCELVLFDDAQALPGNDARSVKYHRRDGTEAEDTIEQLTQVWRLVSDGLHCQSWDHKSARVSAGQGFTNADQGETGNALAQALRSTRVAIPHMGDDGDELQRLAQVQANHDKFRSSCLQGQGGVRTMAPGMRYVIENYPAFKDKSAAERDHVAIRVEHVAVNNLPVDLHEAGLALVEDEGLPEWVRGDDVRIRLHAGPHEQRYANRFWAVHKDVPVQPSYAAERDEPRLRRLTGIVLADHGEITCDALGRCKVQLVGGEPGTDTVVWVRHASPWAGDRHGFHAALRKDTEVDIEFFGPDRPVIVACHYNGRNPPPQAAHQPSLPGNSSQMVLVGRELQGDRQSHLLLDDMPGQLMVQIATDAAGAALSLGELTTPRRDGQADPRGLGGELRTDESLALRSAKQLLISAWKRLNASGHQLSADEHLALMQDCLDLFKSLGQYAAEHQGLPIDEQPQTMLKADVQAAPEQGAPTLNLTAPAGIVATTPKTIVHYAGVNIDCVAQQHYQQAAGGYHVVNAGKGASVFAHQGGIQHIAHHGKLLMQSQHDETRIDSAKDIKLSAAGGKLVGMAQGEITFITSGGAYLKLSGGNVEIGGPGPLTIKTDGHNWDGPASMSTDFPKFSEGDLGRTPRLLRPSDGEPVEGMKLHIGIADGDDVSGQTDSAGKGTKVVASALQRLKTFFYMPRS